MHDKTLNYQGAMHEKIYKGRRYKKEPNKYWKLKYSVPEFKYTIETSATDLVKQKK